MSCLIKRPLMYMKLLFSFVFLFITFESLEARKVEANYTVKPKGITIGSLDWQVKLEKDTYTTRINLKNKGPLSLVYKFKGYYEASGIIKEDILNKYLQFLQKMGLANILTILYLAGGTNDFALRKDISDI